MNSKKKRRRLITGCVILAAALVVAAAAVKLAGGLSGNKTDTSEGLALIQEAEQADVTAIEAKIKKLDERNKDGEDTRSLKERFSSSVVMGDAVTEGFAEYDVLNVSSVISESGGDKEAATLEKLKEVNPKVVFLTYCASDMLESDGDTESYVKQYQKRIEAIQEAVPGANIFINSLLPVTSAAMEKEAGYNELDAYNEALSAMCDKLQIAFLDNASLVKASYYEQDGIHFKTDFYPLWAERMAEGASL